MFTNSKAIPSIFGMPVDLKRADGGDWRNHEY